MGEEKFGIKVLLPGRPPLPRLCDYALGQVGSAAQRDAIRNIEIPGTALDAAEEVDIWASR